MLRVTLEMVPFGQELHKYPIGILEIANVGGDGDLGNYIAHLTKDVYSLKDRSIYTAAIIRYPRKQGAWILVKKVLSKFSYVLKKGE